MRHMELGERPLEAALRGSREIGFTIISMTLSLAAVFIPVLFMSGILGRLFREFAVTLSVGSPVCAASRLKPLIAGPSSANTSTSSTWSAKQNCTPATNRQNQEKIARF